RIRWKRLRFRLDRVAARHGAATGAAVARAHDAGDFSWRCIAIGANPVAGQVRLAVCRSRRPSIHLHAALLVARHPGLSSLGPLRGQRHGANPDETDHSARGAFHVTLTSGPSTNWS